MVNVRGTSWGPAYPYHAELRKDGWAIFDARTDTDLTLRGRPLVGLTEHEAMNLGADLNYGSSPVDTAAVDSTP